jgi:hypothetical protein
MDDLIKVVAMVAALVGLGVGTYAGVTVVSILKRRFDSSAAGPSLDELESIHARLANVEALEARVNELEERVDFAERHIAGQHESERLSSGPPLDHR